MVTQTCNHVPFQSLPKELIFKLTALPTYWWQRWLLHPASGGEDLLRNYLFTVAKNDPEVKDHPRLTDFLMRHGPAPALSDTVPDLFWRLRDMLVGTDEMSVNEASIIAHVRKAYLAKRREFLEFMATPAGQTLLRSA